MQIFFLQLKFGFRLFTLKFHNWWSSISFLLYLFVFSAYFISLQFSERLATAMSNDSLNFASIISRMECMHSDTRTIRLTEIMLPRMLFEACIWLIRIQLSHACEHWALNVGVQKYTFPHQFSSNENLLRNNGIIACLANVEPYHCRWWWGKNPCRTFSCVRASERN